MIRLITAAAASIFISIPAMANLYGAVRTSSGYTSFAQITMQHNYALVQNAVMSIAQQYPQNAKVFELGQNNQGQTIVGLIIGNGPMHNMIVSTHHGNEYGATELALSAAADLAANPIPGQTIYVIPVLNITGYNADRREESVGNDNVNTQDSNRDYEGPCKSGASWRLRSTKALADFIGANHIVASATLHTFGPLVLYPWGISTRDTATPYNAQYITLSDKAAEVSHYQVGNSTDALYPADGAYEDYAFWKYGVWSLLFEVGTTHTPSVAQLNEIDAKNVPGLRAEMMNTPTQNAPDHAFHGACETRMRMLDLHNE